MRQLEMKHVEQVLDRDIEIGSKTLKSGSRKVFSYNPNHQVYSVYIGYGLVDRGTDVESLLEYYNNIR